MSDLGQMEHYGIKYSISKNFLEALNSFQKLIFILSIFKPALDRNNMKWITNNQQDQSIEQC